MLFQLVTMNPSAVLLHHTLSFIVIAFLATLAHPYEINDATDQIAEESSQLESFVEPYQPKDVNVTFDHNELDHEDVSSTTAAATTGTASLSSSNKAMASSTVESTRAQNPDDPLNAILPRIKFSCKNKSEAYYSDLDFCEIFHYCKSNGYRFTFLCPNDSFYNNQLMACEQNATHLRYCKSKGPSTMETITLTSTGGTTVSTTHSPRPSSTDQTHSTEKLFASTEWSTPGPRKVFSFRRHNGLHDDESAHMVRFESTRVSTPSVSTNQVVMETSVAPTSTTISGTEPTLLASVNDHLSTTTLIPPSLFIEPTVSNMVMDETFPSQFDELIARTLANTPVSSSTSTSTSATSAAPSTNNYDFDLTTIPNQKLSTAQMSIPPEHKEMPDMEPIIFESQQVKSIVASESESENVTSNSYTFEFPAKSINSEMLKFSSTKPTKKASPTLDQILRDLDMSNFEISTEKFPLMSYSGSMRKSNQLKQPNSFLSLDDDYRKQPPQPTKSTHDGKFSLSIHKFFKEGLQGSSNYLKTVPKLLRSLNAMRDYDEVSSISDTGKSPSMPRKNDHLSSGPANEESNTSGGNTVSMLSIPVLVPVNLSQEDYRRRMSASVLKPIVIPLKEKGKLIPAYVLQFGSKRHSRHKRSALNGKRLLSLSIKPNLLYQMLPSVLKNVYIKPLGGGAKQASNKQQLAMAQLSKPNLDMLMAAQSAVPLYTLPVNNNNEAYHPGANLAQLLKYSHNYDLSEFNQFIPPYYFVDQHPYLQYRPVSFKKNPIYKRPPLRAKVPAGVSNVTVPISNVTAPTFPISSTPSGLMAVGSSLSGQMVSTPVPSPSMYSGLGATLTGPPSHATQGQPTPYPTNYLDSYSPSAYGSSYFSPLLYIGNSFVGADSSKFKPMMMKKSNFFKKLKHSKNLFNSKDEKPQLEPPPSNYTMPANIYVPDDILEDVQMDQIPATQSNVTTKLDNPIDHKVSNDLSESFNSDESRSIEVFARYNQSSLHNALRNNRVMRDRASKSLTASLTNRELSNQAKINANFFNGTTVKATATTTAKSTLPQTAPKVTTSKGHSEKMSSDHGGGNVYQAQHENGNTGEQEKVNISAGQHGEHLPDDDSNRFNSNLTSYLRQLKTSYTE